MSSVLQPNKVAGVILAGGLATRMQQQDKGLIHYQGLPLVSYAIAALSPVVDQVLINANRHIDRYQQFGLPVISDSTKHFDGPLAGVLAAMSYANADIMVVIPCDCPLIQTEHVQKIVSAYLENSADIAVAFDGKQLHPVFFAVNTALQPSLQAYLASGQRKVMNWLEQHVVVPVNFAAEAEILTNINTMMELSQLENQQRENRHAG